jgi:hypothetical protein
MTADTPDVLAAPRFVVVSRDDLPADIRAKGWDYLVTDSDHCWVLLDTVKRDVVGYDGGAPEDQILVRDWSWVAEALNEVAAEREAAGVPVVPRPVVEWTSEGWHLPTLRAVVSATAALSAALDGLRASVRPGWRWATLYYERGPLRVAQVVPAGNGTLWSWQNLDQHIGGCTPTLDAAFDAAEASDAERVAALGVTS